MKYGKFVALGLVALSVAGCGAVESGSDVEDKVPGISDSVEGTTEEGIEEGSDEDSGSSEESDESGDSKESEESEDSGESDDLNSSADSQVTLTQEELANDEIKASKLDTSNIQPRVPPLITLR